MLSKISYIWYDNCFSFESIPTMKLASLRKIHDNHYRCLFHRYNHFRRHHHCHYRHRHYHHHHNRHRHRHHRHYYRRHLRRRLRDFMDTELCTCVKVKEHLLIRSHCRKEASPIHWLPYIKSSHPRRAIDKNQKSRGNEVLTMPDSWHWYLAEPVLPLPKRKETFGMGSSFQVRHDQPKQAPFWILCWHVSMKGRSIISIQASRRQILSNISSLIRAEYWKSQPRKLCDFCKCWITDNKPVTYKTSVFPAPEKFKSSIN